MSEGKQMNRELWAYKVNPDSIALCDGEPRFKNYGGYWANSNCLIRCCYRDWVKMTGIRLSLRQAVRVSLSSVGDVWDITPGA